MTMTELSTTRLHITPLTPEILPSVLPASLRDAATDISFHSIPTFPENNYGYVTLPTMAADKIKKKLNGSILKGKKFKVESARPQKRQWNEEEETVAENKPGGKKKSKKRKAEDGVVDGYELPSDRKVKRGWTESNSAKKERGKSKNKSKEDKKAKTQTKSKYTEKAECLFRTSVPPNRSSDGTADDRKAKKKKKSSQDAVVHEFAKTVTHPSFLRSAEERAAPTTTFEDGKGWVDAAGHVKEPSSRRIRKDTFRPGKVARSKEMRKAARTSVLQEPNSRQKNSKESSTQVESSDESEDWTSSSGSSSDESSDSENESGASSSGVSSVSFPEDEGVKPPGPREPAKVVDAAAASTSESEEEDEEETDQPSSSKEVHPLEALFKRPAPDAAKSQPALEANTGFSFFGNDDIESDEPQTAPPLTPFTKKDLQARGLRSAAPTPDTALASRHMKWGDDDGMEEDDEEGLLDTPVSKSQVMAAGAANAETEFAKWFWEHRGENNRAWKKRRRDAAKEQRQRENRRKGWKGKS